METVRENKGFHPVLDEDHEYLFIDSCMQAWPDADWDLAHQHGVTSYGVTAWEPLAPVNEALKNLMYWHLVARQNENITTIEKIEDIRAAEQEDKAALLLASQDGTFIGNELHRIEAFYRLGLRMLIPTYNRNNNICGGCNDKMDSGLTQFGQRVVEECNRVGLLLDCSHLARRSSLDIIEKSNDPVIFSHSNSKQVVDCYRNIDDKQIKACAGRGGVIGLTPFGPFTRREGETEWPTLDDFIDHIDHVVSVTDSTEHIGIGTDMSLGTYPEHGHDPWNNPDYISSSHTDAYSEYITGNVRSPRRALRDFNSYPQVTNLIEKLESRGYNENDIENILGRNYLRVFDQVWE